MNAPRLALLVLLLSACGEARGPSDQTPSAPPPGDACVSPPGSLGVPPATKAAALAPSPGPMTESAARAKRLFDSEKWAEAEVALGKVAAGETGDDEGNRQVALYLRAIALFRSKRAPEAAALFGTIAANPGHARFEETLLWVDRLVEQQREAFRWSMLASYEPAHVKKFDNSNQRQSFWRLAFLVGRARYDQGDMTTARTAFDMAKNPQSPWASAATQCQQRVADAH